MRLVVGVMGAAGGTVDGACLAKMRALGRAIADLVVIAGNRSGTRGRAEHDKRPNCFRAPRPAVEPARAVA